MTTRSGTSNAKRAAMLGPSVRHLDGWYEVVGLPEASPVFATREKAEAWLARQAETVPERRQARERACLCCGEAFLSAGAHNRLCGLCRHRDAGPVALSWARPQRRGDGAAR